MKNLRDFPPESRRFIHSLIFPLFIQWVIWSVWLLGKIWELNLIPLGIFPRKLHGLLGILFAPVVHSDLNHIASNALPLFLLMLTLFYFYRTVAYRVFFISWFFVGLLVWISGREAYHVGASGIIYSLAAFLFFSGVIRNYIPLMAISLLITFLYGSMVWGIFPLQPKISWESHMLGVVVGIFCAIYYRNQGPQAPPPFWESEDEEEQEAEDQFTENSPLS